MRPIPQLLRAEIKRPRYDLSSCRGNGLQAPPASAVGEMGHTSAVEVDGCRAQSLRAVVYALGNQFLS